MTDKYSPRRPINDLKANLQAIAASRNVNIWKSVTYNWSTTTQKTPHHIHTQTHVVRVLAACSGKMMSFDIKQKKTIQPKYIKLPKAIKSVTLTKQPSFIDIGWIGEPQITCGIDQCHHLLFQDFLKRFCSELRLLQTRAWAKMRHLGLQQYDGTFRIISS